MPGPTGRRFGARRNGRLMNKNSLTQPYLAGVKTAVGVPAVSLFVGLFGYGTMNQNINFDFSIMLGAVTLIWSMPALMTFTEVVSLGAGVWTVFVAIVFTNLRNIPMIVTALPLIRAEQKIGWNDLLIAQLLSPTAWIHILLHGRELPIAVRQKFFTAFSLTIFISALTGSLAGYFGTSELPPEIINALLLLTPLYLLLFMVSVRKLSGYLALGLGAVLVPWLMQWSVEWGLAIGGISAGTLGFLLGDGVKRHYGP